LQAIKPVSKEEKLKDFLDFVFTYCRDDWELVKKAIIIRDNFTCTRCGGKEMLDVHHLNGTARNDPENLTTLCRKCHESIHGKTLPLPPSQSAQPTASQPIDRQTILNSLSPAGLAQKTAFGELLSAAIAMKKFTTEELAQRAKMPKNLVELFCKRMQELGYAKYENNQLEISLEVIK
jgi:hypothetical protein